MKITIDNKPYFLIQLRYNVNKRPCLMIMTTSFTLVIYCTVNLPDVKLKENEIIIKDNEGVLKLLIDNNVISNPRNIFKDLYICDMIIKLEDYGNETIR